MVKFNKKLFFPYFYDWLKAGPGISITPNSDKTRTISSIGSGGTIDLFIVVTKLPEVGESNKIYLFPLSVAKDNDVFEEWAYINGEWELLGSITVDLSNYYNKKESDDRYLQINDSKRVIKHYTEDEENIALFDNVKKDTITLVTLLGKDVRRSISINQEDEAVLHTILFKNTEMSNIDITFSVPVISLYAYKNPITVLAGKLVEVSYYRIADYIVLLNSSTIDLFSK